MLMESGSGRAVSLGSLAAPEIALPRETVLPKGNSLKGSSSGQIGSPRCRVSQASAAPPGTASLELQASA